MASIGRSRRAGAATFDEIARDYERNPGAADLRVGGGYDPTYDLVHLHRFFHRRPAGAIQPSLIVEYQLRRRTEGAPTVTINDEQYTLAFTGTGPGMATRLVVLFAVLLVCPAVVLAADGLSCPFQGKRPSMQQLRSSRKDWPGLCAADLRGFKLHNVNLSGIHLRGADFSDVDFREVDLSSADLREVDFSGAYGVGSRRRGDPVARQRLPARPLGPHVLREAV